jgi:hypothetical protein
MCSSRRMEKSTCQPHGLIHPDPPESLTKDPYNGIKIGDHERSTSRASSFRNSRFCFTDVQNKEIIYSDLKGKGVSMHSSVKACVWRWVAVFRTRKQHSYPMSMGLDVSRSGHFEVNKISCPLRELNHVARSLVSKLTVFCRLPLDWL